MSYTALSHGGVARVSTMVVDSDLDMGGFAVKTPTIEEAVAGGGTRLIHPFTIPMFSPTATDTLRASDDTEVEQTFGAAFVKVKEISLPGVYVNGAVKLSVDVSANNESQVKFYVNDTPAGVEHAVSYTSPETVSEDIDVKGGDVVSVWAKESGINPKTTLSNFRLHCDDSITLLTKNQPW
jgi:hypothetical protein